MRRHKVDIEEESRKEVIRNMRETNLWYRHFMESFIESQRAFYDELYKGTELEDNWVVIIDPRRTG